MQIERCGMADFDGIFREFADENESIIRNLQWQCEWYRYMIYPACSRAHNNVHIESGVQIFDLTDGSVRKMMSKQCLALLKMGSKVA